MLILKKFYDISKVSHYGDRSRIGMILKFCWTEMICLFDRICFYTKKNGVSFATFLGCVLFRINLVFCC